MSLRDKVWWALATRPLIGHLIPERHIDPLPGSKPMVERPAEPCSYLVQHSLTKLYWRNPWPHHLVSTPEWGKIQQAHRFYSRQYAVDVMLEQGMSGKIVEIPLASF